MSKHVLAQLVTEMSADSAKFQKEIGRAQAANKRYKKSAEDTSKSNDIMEKTFRRAAQSTAALEGPLGGVSGRLSSMATLLGSVSAAGVLAGLSLTAVAMAVKNSITVYDAFEQKIGRHIALLQATNSAVGFTHTELHSQAKAVAEATLQSTNGVMDAQAILLTFKSVSGDIFTRSIALSADLAAVVGNVSSASMMLGKALESPKDGLTALKRAGVSFTAAEKEKIIALADSNQLAAAQTMILDKLQKQVGGAGAGAGSGLAGSIDLLGQRWEELNIEMGKTPAKAATGFFNTLASGVDGFRHDLFPDDKERFREISGRRLELKKMLEDMGNFSDLPTINPFGPSQNNWRNAQVELAILTKEAKAIQKRIDEEIRAQIKARKSAHDEQERLALANQEALKKAENERAAKQLARDQKNSAAKLKGLDRQLGDEHDRIILAWEARQASIEQMVLSEHQIRKYGFENLEELKDYYRQLSDEKFHSDMATMEQRANTELKKKQDVWQREIAAITQNAQRKAALSGAGEGNTEAIDESFRYQDELDALNAHYEEMKAATAGNEAALSELKKQYQTAEKELYSEHQLNLTDIGKREEQQRQSETTQGYQSLLSVMSEYFDGMEGKRSGYARMAIKIGSTLLDEEKRKSISSIWSNTYDTAMKAYGALADIPVVGPLLGGAAAGVVLAAGGMYTAKVAGLSGGRQHGGGTLADSMYRINEAGPEIYSYKNEQYLLTGSTGGYVTPHDKAMTPFKPIEPKAPIASAIPIIMQSNSSSQAVHNNDNRVVNNEMVFPITQVSDDSIMDAISKNSDVFANMMTEQFAEWGINLQK